MSMMDDGTVTLDAGNIIWKVAYEQGRIDALNDAIKARADIGDEETADILFLIKELEALLRAQ